MYRRSSKMSEMNWKLADGLAHGTKQNDALKKALEGSGREKRRLHDRWRRVRRPAEAMLRFAYRDLGSSDFRSAVREVADFWAYNPEGWPLLRQAGQGVGGDRPTLVTVQTHLRGA